jgi:hypothetical protein
MDESELESIRSSMKQAMTERIGRAMRDVWERLSDVVGHFAATMSDGDKVFRDATVRNLEELVELLPGLNVTEDPDLAAIGAEIKAKLTGYDPKDLRKKPQVRSEAAKQAAEIVERMQGFMSAFGVAE